jgi:SAM-dependent methyltransferase
MQIPWRTKSLAFALIDLFRLSPLLYFMQKNVTKRSRRPIKQAHPRWQFHAENLAALNAPKVLEVGAGKSLAQNIYLSPLCGSQLLVDLNPMLDPVLADTAAQSISHIAPVEYKKIANTHDLAAYNIFYKAPVDISRSDLADSSLDACISTSTLEHIPEESLRVILKELRRVLRPGGVLSAVVDYSDHYSHTDKNISRLEFLRFENYRPYNHRSHFQNRLRHPDFERLFREAGFTVQKAEPHDFVPPPGKIAACFDAALPDTFATEGRFVLINGKAG